MSGYGVNPIFFNEKIKTGRPKHPIRLITSHFSLTPPNPPLSGLHMCITPNSDSDNNKH